MTLLSQIPVIDVDTHLIEPPDLWTSRLPKRWADDAPHLEWDESVGKERWHVGRHALSPATQFDVAGWREFHPSIPPTWEDADPAGWDPDARLARMDEYGVQTQVLFPNILGFEVYAFLELDPDLRLECIRAYNNFQTEFCSRSPQRLIPLMFLPFWDVAESVKEMRRCAAMGHKGVNFGVEFERLGFPPLRSDHWDPILGQAQDLGLPITFHVGFSKLTSEEFAARKERAKDPLEFPKSSALLFAGNMNGIAEIIMGRICHRFPQLNFISVESGYGYVPFLLDALDWQFENSSARFEYPDMLLPSEYFRRQIYATFWFEHRIGRQIDLYPDNVMFESDFPHPTSLSPGPGSTAKCARDTIEANLADVPDDILRKILHDNAVRVFNLTA
jgi:uncharacterized protein